MKDQISEQRIKLLHPAIRNEVQLLINDIEPELPSNCTIRITYTLRTFAEQDALYAQGRTLPGKVVTKAKGGQSNHNYGLAFDFVILIDGKASWSVDENWLKVIDYFEKNGYIAGHRWKFKDSPHIEKTFGNTWRTLLPKYNSGHFIEGTKYVKLS